MTSEDMDEIVIEYPAGVPHRLQRGLPVRDILRTLQIALTSNLVDVRLTGEPLELSTVPQRGGVLQVREVF